MRCETFYRFCVSSSPSFFPSDDRSVLVRHVYSALSEEMSASRGRVVTFGIRALGCVVNLGKLSGRDNIRIRESVFVIILVFKAIYIYTITSIRMKSYCTSTTMESLIVSFFQIDDEPIY